MTPKKKAKELIKRFTPYCRIYPEIIDNQFILSNDVKICALIAVDEIIDAIDWHEFETPNKEIHYWQEVKQEIENL